MAQVLSSTTLRQFTGLKKQIAEMMLEMLDDIIANCESSRQIAADVWIYENGSEYMTRFGEGEIAAYDDVIQNLKTWKRTIEDDGIRSGQ